MPIPSALHYFGLIRRALLSHCIRRGYGSVVPILPATCRIHLLHLVLYCDSHVSKRGGDGSFVPILPTMSIAAFCFASLHVVH